MTNNTNNTKKIYCRVGHMFGGMVINPIDDHEAKVVFLKYLKELHTPAEYLLDYSDLSAVEAYNCYHVIDAEKVKQLPSISVIDTYELNGLRQTVENLTAAIKAGADRETRLELCEDALQELTDWAKAYPLSVFPEPDFKRASEVLRANGMTVDAISASAMRHLLVRVQEIVKKAMTDEVAT